MFGRVFLNKVNNTILISRQNRKPQAHSNRSYLLLSGCKGEVAELFAISYTTEAACFLRLLDTKFTKSLLSEHKQEQ